MNYIKLKERKGTLMLNLLRKSRAISRFAIVLSALYAGHASAQTQQNRPIKFVNVVDSTQGLSDFSQFPAINNQGSIAFLAQKGTDQKVFKWDRRNLNALATTTDPIASFSDDVAINDAGTVVFRAALTTGRAVAIFTNDGVTTKTIVNSADQGFPGFGIGTASINSSGTVAFQAFRSGFRSNVIFTGDGGNITPVLDTLTSDFENFGAVAINASGKIVFEGDLKGGESGIFLVKPNQEGEGKNGTGPASVIDVVDSSNHPEFFQYGDPVINSAGIVADFGAGGITLEVFSGNGKGIVARNDPASNLFINTEHPSINSHGAIAFSVVKANGEQCIFVELTGGASLVPVLQTGDLLFGSSVTAVSVGRFAFNDHFRLAFEYELLDGRSGIAVASLSGGEEDQDE
jgi:hypothetical protein